MNFKLLLALAVLFVHEALIGQFSLINAGSNWKYFDQGQAPVGWNLTSFDDATWAQGNAELGYGDGDEATVVGFGPSSSNKYMTTYFRRSFTVVDPTQFAVLLAELVRDDGAVVYLNGIEIWRSNMPSGSIEFSTPAAGTVAWPNENNWYSLSVSASYLVAGTNVLAVEIHQDEPSSSDISFNFRLNANTTLAANVTRGPYLQKATQSSIILRWRTSVATDSRVRYGLSPANLDNTLTLPQFVTDHSIEITGLDPNLTYYYAIGTNSQDLASGTNLFFTTLPVAGTEEQYRFLVLGDAGTGYIEQIEAKNAAIQFNGANHFDGVILLGDNAYQSGFDSEYQSNFFDNKYNEIFENTVIWPAPGNHDYNQNLPFSPSPAYFDIFDCPTNGEVGGVPSGTEKYYSFDYGNVHFVSLDSYSVPRSNTGAMANWIQQDLAANSLPWVVVYFHHPPYTKGSHDSDNFFFIDGELVDMRQNIMPILENYGVDLILSGHSHSYERSFLIDGHYGNSSTFGAQHLKDGGTGSFPEDCPYHKNTENGSGHQGAVYSVVGCSGKLSGVQGGWPHPAMVSYTYENVGTMLLTIEKNRLDAVFLTKDNVVYDKFTIVKNAGIEHTIEVCPNDPVSLAASWPHNAVWNPTSNQGQTLTIATLSDATVTASDALGCIEDVFHLVVIEADTCSALGDGEIDLNSAPLVNVEGTALRIRFDQDLDFMLFDASGKLVRRIAMRKPEHMENISNLPQGIYFLKNETLQITTKLFLHD
jgi:acid phosphatase type 7